MHFPTLAQLAPIFIPVALSLTATAVLSVAVLIIAGRR